MHMNSRIRLGWLVFAAMVLAVISVTLQVGLDITLTPTVAIRGFFLLISIVGLFAYALGIGLVTCLFWRCYATLFGAFMVYKLPKFFAHYGDGSGKYVAFAMLVSATVGLILLALFRYAKLLDSKQSHD